MPKNCSRAFIKMTEMIDKVLLSGNKNDITDLKSLFGLQDVSHHDDFAA